MTVSREMTLDEYINVLPDIHLARRQYKELLEEHEKLKSLLRNYEVEYGYE